MPDLPPIPPITHLDQEMPQQSDPVVVATSAERLLWFAVSDKGSVWVSEIPHQLASSTNPSVLVDYRGNSTPRQYTLTLRQYWRQVSGSYTRVNAGGSFAQTVTTTHGVSTTDSNTLSAELGVDADGLSAKVTATFEQAVEVTDETSIQKTYTIEGPADGMVRVWLLWQLVDEIVALDAQGNVIPISDGRQGDIELDVFFTGVPFLDLGPLVASLSNPNVQQAFPSQTYVPAQADFPASAS